MLAARQQLDRVEFGNSLPRRPPRRRGRLGSRRTSGACQPLLSLRLLLGRPRFAGPPDDARQQPVAAAEWALAAASHLAATAYLRAIGASREGRPSTGERRHCQVLASAATVMLRAGLLSCTPRTPCSPCTSVTSSACRSRACSTMAGTGSRTRSVIVTSPPKVGCAGSRSRRNCTRDGRTAFGNTVATRSKSKHGCAAAGPAANRSRAPRQAIDRTRMRTPCRRGARLYGPRLGLMHQRKRLAIAVHSAKCSPGDRFAVEGT